jgi:hypothetical protein
MSKVVFGSPREKTLAILARLAIVIVPLAVMFQGLDFTDTGWALSNYQWAFVDPQCVSYWFHLWLLNIVGGAWNALFSGLGLLGMRLGAVVLFWTACWFVYRTFKDLIPPLAILGGLALGVIGTFTGRIIVIHYNNVSVLFMIASGCFTLLGIDRGKRWSLFVGGLLGVLSAFARIPNVLVLSAVLLLLFESIRTRRLSRDQIVGMAVYCGGVVAGVVLAFVVMYALGHLGLYLSALHDLFADTRIEGNQRYGVFAMLKRFMKQHIRAIYRGSLVFAVFWVAAQLRMRIRRPVLQALFAGAVMLLVAFWKVRQWQGDATMWISLGFAYGTGLLILISDTNASIKRATLFMFILLMTLSVGSDTGMRVANYGLVFVMPLLVWYWAMGNAEIALPRRNRVVEKVLGSRLRRSFALLAIGAYALTGIALLYVDIYRDSGDRLRMIATVNHPRLRGIFTTPERARATQELLDELHRYVSPGDYLLTYGSIGMVQYLAGTRPYGQNSWLDLYVPSQIETKFKEDRARLASLPVAVIARRQTRSKVWPRSEELSPNEMDGPFVRGFLETNGYSVVWENEMFAILVPKKGA